MPDSALAKSVKGRGKSPRDRTDNVSGSADSRQEQKFEFPPVQPRWNPAKNGDNTEVAEDRNEIVEYVRRIFERNRQTELKGFVGPLASSKEYDYYSARVCLNTEEALSLAKINQSDEQWRKARKVRITASVCYELYTYYNNDNGTRDWTQKLGSIIKPLEKKIPSLAYGKATEPLALQRYREKNLQHKIATVGLVVDPSVPFLGCSPDGIVVDQDKLLEIKCPTAGDKLPLNAIVGQLKYVYHRDGIYLLRPKHAYYGQVQLSMYILKLKSTDFVIYSRFDNDYLCIKVNYDDKFVRDLISVLSNVYFNLFLPILCN